MLDQTAVGLSCRQRFHYSWRDVILYNLSVGAGMGDLPYVYEKQLKAIPTFGVIPCTATFGTEPYTPQPIMPTSQIEGLRTDGSLHMDHMLQICRPIPTSGVLDIEKVITNVYDRGPGKGAKITVEIRARNEAGELCFVNRMGYLNRWAEGCGGEKPEEVGKPVPDREPDFVVEGRFPPNAPVLYRLTGDTYPIHVDPDITRKVGLPGPLMHGLCGLGNACRILIDRLIPGEPERVSMLAVRFRSPSLPTDPYLLQVWRNEDTCVQFRMIHAVSGAPILDAGLMQWNTGAPA